MVQAQYPGLETGRGYAQRVPGSWGEAEEVDSRGHGLQTGGDGFREYVAGLMSILDVTRFTEYADLPEWVFEELKARDRRRNKV